MSELLLNQTVLNVVYVKGIFATMFFSYSNQHFAKHLHPVQNNPFLLIVSFFYQTLMTGLLNIFAA